MNRLIINLALLAWGMLLGVIAFGLRRVLNLTPGTRTTAIVYGVVFGGGLIVGTMLLKALRRRFAPPPDGR